jgi:Bacterial lipid A biosynthesis acyltransferase
MDRGDLLKIIKVAAFVLIAWSTPPRLWRKISTIMSGFGATPSLPLPFYQRILGPTFDAASLSRLNRNRRINSREAALQVMGLQGTWRTWHPKIHLHGAAHLQKALENRRGAIFWLTDSPYSPLIFKMALSNAGYRASQLTRPNHGFGFSSSFGIRFINPLWTHVEDRFIDERVTIQDDNAASALAILRTRLADNRIVIITIVGLAHNFVEVPFFQHVLRVPIGPIRLAQETGAALLPAFVIANVSGSFRVTIESPLPSCNKQNTFERTASSYAKLLEPYVSAHPEQWTGWGSMLSKTLLPQRLESTSLSSGNYTNHNL